MSFEREPVLRVEGVGKVYRLYERPHHRLLQALMPRQRFFREFEALNPLSFELGAGQTLGIIGHNGAGKSTLLQLVCGTLTPSSGQVHRRGRLSALLELGTGFNPEFSGRENVRLSAAILGLSPAELEARFDDILAFADIGHFIDQPVKTYSSGMYVRLAFSVAVHVDPELLVVDEALAVGDALFQARCMSRIRELIDRGTALLFTSHDIASVKAICERCLWLERGQVRAFGPTAEVTRDYDRHWITQANAQQVQPAANPAATPEAEVALLAVQLLADGSPLSTPRLAYGQALTVRLRLQVRQPCRQLVVSLHIKNRQNQHLVGTHSADDPRVHGVDWPAGAVFELDFTLDVQWHAGPYSITVVVASLTDTQHYADARFPLWADDVASIEVLPRNVFPLSDWLEPPRRLAVLPRAPRLVLDDFFPDLLTGFRVAEYNALMQADPAWRVLSANPDFVQQHAHYAERYPELASRVLPLRADWLAGAQQVYVNFLNNAAQFLPLIEAQRLPFVLTLYPGGGLGLNEPASDAKLRQVLASPWLKGLIVTQPVVREYVRPFLADRPELPVQLIPGLVVNPLYWEPLAQRPRYGSHKPWLDVAFVAERYMDQAANKGYPEFLAAMRLLADLPMLRVHVVGGGHDPHDWQGLAQPVQCHGRLTTADFREHLATIDLVVSPNRPGLLHAGNFDGFPTGCCVEAGLCGTAFVASDALGQDPGLPEQAWWPLRGEAEGWPQQIAAAVRELAADPLRLAQMGERLQSWLAQAYAPQRQIGERQALLDRLLREAH